MEGCPDLCYFTSHLPRGASPRYHFCDLALSSQWGLLSLQQSMSKFALPSDRQERCCKEPRGCLPLLEEVHLQGKPTTGRLAQGVSPRPVSNSVCYSEALRNLGDSLHKLYITGEMTEWMLYDHERCVLQSPESP